MQLAALRKRKRASQNTACWDCYRCHRACDGERPCRRCISLDRTATCRDPDPNERIPRKKKKKKDVANIGVVVGPQKVKDSKRCFFVVDPQSFSATQPWFIELESSETTSSTKNSNTNVSSGESALEATILEELVHKVKQLNEATQSLHESQSLLKDQVVGLHQKTQEAFEAYRGYPTDDATDTDIPQSSTPPSAFPQRQTRILMSYQPTQPEEIMQELLQEMDDIGPSPPATAEYSPNALALASVPNDAAHLGQNFMPFAIQSGNQPFLILKPVFADMALSLLAQALHGQSQYIKFPSQSCLLTASNSFCELAQYSEDEIIGFNVRRMLPEPIRVADDERDVLHFLLPQPRNMHMSPVLKVKPYWRAKDGTYLHSSSNIQFFYSEDGRVSFIVMGVENYTYTNSDTSPFIPPPRLSPSLLSKTWDGLEVFCEPDGISFVRPPISPRDQSTPTTEPMPSPTFLSFAPVESSEWLSMASPPFHNTSSSLEWPHQHGGV